MSLDGFVQGSHLLVLQFLGQVTQHSIPLAFQLFEWRSVPWVTLSADLAVASLYQTAQDSGRGLVGRDRVRYEVRGPGPQFIAELLKGRERSDILSPVACRAHVAP